MDDIEILRENLQKYMSLNGFSKVSLSRKIGLGETYIKDIFNGKVKNPSVFHVQKIANILGIQVDCLLNKAKQQGESEV